jgi:putative ABC transport system substrate-binding protein
MKIVRGQWSVVSKHAFCFVAIALVFVLCLSAEAQHAVKIPRVGLLASASGRGLVSLQRQLQELGYIEGENILFELRSAERNLDRLPGLASELVRLDVRLIVAVATPAAHAAKQATKTIPIVMVDVADPVATGLVPDIARPSGNITGVATLSPELSGKRLELLKEAVPSAVRVAIFANPNSVTNPLQLKQIFSAAQPLGLELEILKISKSEELEPAFASMVRQRANAFMVLPDPIFNSERTRIVALAAKHKLAGIYDRPSYADTGGLMTYGPNFPELLRRAAVYVHKIMKGTKPAELPVEQPTKFEFVINLRTAKQIGLTIPPNVLARADKVIR